MCKNIPLLSRAIAEKIAAITQYSYLQSRGNRGNRQLYDAILAKVPDIEPDSNDQLTNINPHTITQ